MKGKKKAKKNRAGWIIGSIGLTVMGFAIIPSAINKYSSKIYKSYIKKDTIDFDNLGPKIVKKNKEGGNE